MRLILVEPDIPQNVGAAIRAAACFGAEVEIVGPCGFPLDSRVIKRVAMDYGLLAPLTAHSGWSAFLAAARARGDRLILLTTRGAESIWDFRFGPADALLLGRESAGVSDDVRESADARIRIPMVPGARSLNVAVAGAVALSEARRQIGWGRGASF